MKSFFVIFLILCTALTSRISLSAKDLGGIQVAAFCQKHLPGSKAVIVDDAGKETRQNRAPNRAYGWRCKQADGSLHAVQMDVACHEQRGLNSTAQSDPNDAYSWKCVQEGNLPELVIAELPGNTIDHVSYRQARSRLNIYRGERMVILSPFKLPDADVPVIVRNADTCAAVYGEFSIGTWPFHAHKNFPGMGSIALENARLFAQTHQMAADLRTALEKERWLAIEKQKMGAYIPKHVLDEISRSREQKLALGGKSVVASVLFSDIKGFTALSEQLRPEVVVTFLNEYMTAMANVVEAEEGLVDKFIGDGVMAVFLPRGEGDNHALRAVRASIRMQQELAGLKLRWRTTRPEVANLLMRVGINTGEMIAGNVGSETRMDYTVIGDNVNVASRIESNGVGGEVHISEATYAYVRGFIQAVRLAPIQVKNRVAPVQIYSVVIAEPAADAKE